MNALGGILAPADVALGVAADTPEQVIGHAAGMLARNHGLAGADVLAALRAREALGCTALGHGVALPHARMTGLDAPSAAFVRTAAPVAFDAPDGRPVACFLVLVVPAEAAQAHLKLLAEAATLLNDAPFRAALRGAEDPAEVVRLFAHWPVDDAGT